MKRLFPALFALLSMGTIVSSSASNPAGGPSRSPFFMFTTSKFEGAQAGEIRNVLNTYVTDRDYLGLALAKEFPELAQRVGRLHLYVLPPSLRAVGHQAIQCGDTAAGLIVYDGETWSDTPADEQADMPGAISRGKALVKSSGCHNFGIAPGGELVGILPDACSYDLARALHHRVDWDDVTLFNVQAQRLLSDDCSARAGVPGYVAFVSSIAHDVRSKNPHTRISAQLSFRYTPPGRMIEAIRRLRNVVDGFYLAYPSNVGPRCAYCTSQNLAVVLKALRSS